MCESCHPILFACMARVWKNHFWWYSLVKAGFWMKRFDRAEYEALSNEHWALIIWSSLYTIQSSRIRCLFAVYSNVACVFVCIFFFHCAIVAVAAAVVRYKEKQGNNNALLCIPTHCHTYNSVYRTISYAAFSHGYQFELMRALAKNKEANIIRK